MANAKRLPNLSIIIPTLNEANHLPLLLADLKAWPSKLDLTIIDGGSSDLTISIAKIQGINIIKSLQSNRGYQLSLGASNAKGDWLLFLHADSRLEEKWVNNLIKIMNNSSSEKIAWYFNFRIKNYQLQFRFLEIAVAIRSYLFKRPYGDQGLLIHKDLYNFSGGYSPLKIMEDLEFIIRITRYSKLKSVGVNIFTDNSKWLNSNVIKRALINASLRRKWRQGYKSDILSKEYYS